MKESEQVSSIINGAELADALSKRYLNTELSVIRQIPRATIIDAIVKLNGNKISVELANTYLSELEDLRVISFDQGFLSDRPQLEA